MSRRPISLAFILVLAPILYFSCKAPEKPVTKDEASQLAKKIIHSVQNHNSVILDNIFDAQVFARRVASEAKKSLSKDIVNGAMEGLKSAHFGQQIVTAVGEKGSYELVKQYEKEGKQHLLFRMYNAGSVNYHDFELVKIEEEVKAADVFIYLSGENLSKTFGDALLMMQENLTSSSKSEQELVSNMKKIKSVMAQRDFQKAEEVFESFPPEMQRQKMFQLIHVQIGEGLGNDEYSKALTQYRTLFPNDPNTYLLSVDAYVLQKKYPEALDAVNKLDSLINKDPFQDYYRGLMYKLMEDSTHSRECFERLHQNMPAFGNGTIELITIYANDGQVDKAAQLLKQSEADKSISEEEGQQLSVLHPNLGKVMKAAGQ
jgi:tetratricopeptide (TPR) repeat protein